jgi:hypothetical protein
LPFEPLNPPGITPVRRAALKTPALQTLRVTGRRVEIAKRLDCVRFIAALETGVHGELRPPTADAHRDHEPVGAAASLPAYEARMSKAGEDAGAPVHGKEERTGNLLSLLSQTPPKALNRFRVIPRVSWFKYFPL